MKVNVTPRRLFTIAASALTLAVCLLIVGVFVGASVGPRPESDSPLKLMAESAAQGQNISLATGLIDDGREGLFMLDHLNGNLQCWVLNSRTNEIGGVYRTNVFDVLTDLKAGGENDFVLTTGNFLFNNRGNQVPASSVAYVAEGKSGIVAGFGFRFTKVALQQAGGQEGILELIFQAPIRDLQLRDQ